MSAGEGEEGAEGLLFPEGLEREEGEGGAEEGVRRGEEELEKGVDTVSGGDGDCVPMEDTLGFEGEGRGVKEGLEPEGGALWVGGGDSAEDAEPVAKREGDDP